ncbi:carbon-nitrogen hydrolase family protein [Zavarzinia compransoris]|uniref:Carbon-nitrogen hydrolase n=1 Tax=Zavarzinia compransoris TaxID=1264899 RepID=A0A317E271_9PROT|nr:carbon-nitrogen hydrolase family protein [Zavarzinia compransoris]PWR20712.1 carbon-nitrogen hydrolase [Zavarzinia compransoris]TDP44461.1 putative amidohydrolase [Zavarzinia compransoris]
MRIAIYQGPPGAPGKAAVLDLLERRMAEAAAAGARLLVAPEMIVGGYNIGPAGVAAAAETADGPAAARLAAAAREHRIAVAYGYAERDPATGAVYNAAQAIDSGGTRLVSHRKCHLFGDLDRAAFAPGEDLAPIFEIEGLRCGILICYDVEFPEAVRSYALQGVDLVLVPTALMLPFDFIPEKMVPTRAFENQVFIAYANRIGTEGDLTYAGLSVVAAPDGVDRARAGRGEELLLADIDPGAAAAARAANPYLADRRPRLYR